ILSDALPVRQEQVLWKNITPQLVTLNGTVCTDVSKQLSEGDVFSVRGKGKFILQCIGETGRKGNIHITVKKYI
ncbi:MAG: hypothetical protein ACLST1_07365, partial [[Eubacterium] siraeum]